MYDLGRINIQRSDNGVIKGNTIYNLGSEEGIYISQSDNNIFENNNITDTSSSKAISLTYNSLDNIFRYNLINNVNHSFDYGITSGNLYVNGVDTPNSDPANYRNISKYIDLTESNTIDWIFLNISYQDSDYSPLDESSLRIWRYNTTDNEWQTDTGTAQKGVDTTNNYVYANITKFSDFGPFGEEGDIQTNLTLSATDDCCSLPHTIIVNYTNETGDYISGASCNVTFDNSDVLGLSDTGSYYYNNTKEYSCDGNTGAYPHIYNITCYKSGYELQKDNSTFVTYVGPYNATWQCDGGTEEEVIPEFNIIGIFLILIISIAGYIATTFVRKRK